MKKEYYEEYARLETTHWWFRARLNILSSMVSDNLQVYPSATPAILNAGVATGQTTRMLQQYGNVTSLEYDEDCCAYLRHKAGIEVTQGSLTELPFESNSFDMVCAFDVIEHIEDDQAAVDEIHRVLKPNGIAIITVPAFMFLWSEHDEINLHHRRYRLGELNRLINSKLSTQYASYFNFFLFPPVGLVRMLGKLTNFRKSKDKELKSDFEFYESDSFVNKVLYKIFNFEKKMVGKMKLPFGVSIISVSKKPD